MGPPEEGAVAALRYLSRSYHVIVLTGEDVDKPPVLKSITDWLDHYRVPYEKVTNIKPPVYDFVIDNRAIHYDSWKRVLLKLANVNEDSYTDSRNA